MPALSALLERERHRAKVGEELASRYEEIDLLYTISEVLGQHRAARRGGADDRARGSRRRRRATCLDHGVDDASTDQLRTIAARGFTADDEFFCPGRAIPTPWRRGCSASGAWWCTIRRCPRLRTQQRAARLPGQAFLSVPICYASQGAAAPLHRGHQSHRPRSAATASRPGSQAPHGDREPDGAAIENARLAERDRQQQRVRRELELAHDLQLRLLPSPSVLHGEAAGGGAVYSGRQRRAATSTPSAGWGRDASRVMLGDVSSHGFAAALVMALVLSAAGIHVEPHRQSRGHARRPPRQCGRRASLGGDVLQRVLWSARPAGRHAALRQRRSPPRVPHSARGRAGAAARRPARRWGSLCMGVSEARQIAWDVEGDLLCLWTDGLVDAANEEGERYGEARLHRGTDAPTEPAGGGDRGRRPRGSRRLAAQADR